MDTFCQPPVTTNTQGNIANVPNERRISSNILAEMIKGFKGLTLQSTINDSVYYHSEEDDPESDPNKNPKVDNHTSDVKKRQITVTDTTNGNDPHKSLINQLIPEIIPVVIPSIDQTTADGDAASEETLHVCCTILSKGMTTDAARGAARVFRTLANVSWHDTDRTTPRDGNTYVRSTRLNSPVRIGGSTTVYPNSTGSQEIISPRGSIGTQEIRNNKPLDTSINGIYAKHRGPVPTWIKVTCRKFSNKSSADVYSCFWMNLTRDSVLTESPNFMNLGLLSVHTLDELEYVFTPNNRIGRPTDGSNWPPPGHSIGEVKEDRVSRTGSEQNYNTKTDFETRRENKDLRRQNNSMSRPPLDSTSLGTNTTNGKCHQLTRF